MNPRNISLAAFILLSLLLLPCAEGSDEANSYDLKHVFEKGQVFTKAIYFEASSKAEESVSPDKPATPRPRKDNPPQAREITYPLSHDGPAPRNYSLAMQVRFQIMEVTNGKVTKYKIVFLKVNDAFNGFSKLGIKKLKGEWAIMKLDGDTFKVDEYSTSLKKFAGLEEPSPSNDPTTLADAMIEKNLARISFEQFQRPDKAVAIGETWKGLICQNLVSADGLATYKLEKVYDDFKTSKNLPVDINAEHVTDKTKALLVSVNFKTDKGEVNGKILLDAKTKRIIAMRLKESHDSAKQALAVFRYFPKETTNPGGIEFKVMSDLVDIEKRKPANVVIRWRNLTDKVVHIERKFVDNPRMVFDIDNLETCMGKWGRGMDKDLLAKTPLQLEPFGEYYIVMGVGAGDMFFDDEAVLGLDKGECNMRVKSGVIVDGKNKVLVSNTIKVFVK